MTASLALGSALPALAESSASSSSASSKPSMMRVDKMRKNMNALSKKFDPTCVSANVKVREAAVGAAWTAFATSMTTAYSTRGSALATAWANTDPAARRTAIKAAWSAFHKSAKSARETLRKAQMNARKAFKDAVTPCGISTADALHGVEPDEIDVNVTAQ